MEVSSGILRRNISLSLARALGGSTIIRKVSFIISSAFSNVNGCGLWGPRAGLQAAIWKRNKFCGTRKKVSTTIVEISVWNYSS